MTRLICGCGLACGRGPVRWTDNGTAVYKRSELSEFCTPLLRKRSELSGNDRPGRSCRAAQSMSSLENRRRGGGWDGASPPAAVGGNLERNGVSTYGRTLIRRNETVLD